MRQVTQELIQMAASPKGGWPRERVPAPPDPPENLEFEAIDAATESAFRALRDEISAAKPALEANFDIDDPGAAAERLRLVREILRSYGDRCLKGRDTDFEND